MQIESYVFLFFLLLHDTGTASNAFTERGAQNLFFSLH